ncbi:MAG TPA: amino acid adenylation domain-containing protein, partial [Candidatus Angelobacter sp.]|nr:amino acid adenylation domain-containing protein [Candidatus Angelobacter sp.]
HHIVSDGWSESVFNHELMVLYEALREGRENPLRPLRVQYADFALWQRRWLEGGALDRGLSYWKEQLAGIPARLELPADRPRPALQTFGGDVCRMTLSAVPVAGLKRLSQDHQSTLYMTLLAVFGMLLSRYSGQDDIVVGSPIANRQDEQLEALIGFFVNSLVMRVRPRGEMSFGELLGQVRQTALAAYEHQDVPFERLVEELSPERSLNTTPLFQVMFALQNAPMGQQRLKQLEVTPVGGGELRVRFDLEVHALESGGEITLYWQYNRDLFDRWRMEQMARHYVQMLEAVVRDPGCAAGRVEMLSAMERHQLLYEWNDTGTAFPRDKCVHELFEEQVEKTPKATAVVFEEEEFSYAELNARANRLAHYLRELGVKPDERVAICAERGLEMVVALLAVLKAGGAYVPLDPAYPVERLRFMIEDSAPAALLTQGHLEKLFTGIDSNLPVLDLTAATPAWQDHPETNPSADAIGLRPEHLAYVIYTSGSTGIPKGVVIEHLNAVNFISWGRSSFTSSALARTLFSTSLNFDLAVFECFVPLACGAMVRIVPNALELARIQVDATLINTVPSAMSSLVEAGRIPQTVHTINLAGEPLKRALVENIFATTQVSVVCNLYGPSETTTYSTWVAMQRNDGFVSHIGRPIANTRIYILDAHGEPVPVGVTGELFIGGAGVARGYLNRPELTAEKFLQDPFTDDPNGRMYRTGDLARWLGDGNIEFLGRNDFQVKIRGFRIELGEIEARLVEQPAVREAVVLAREDTPGDKRLVAYYTTALNDGPDANAPGAEQLRTYLSASLPGYMVPAAYIRLESLPLTPNGKLDRKALPAPEMDFHSAQGFEPPQGDVEIMLAAIWTETLRLDHVSRHDDFFRLGGHSLLTLRVARLLQERGFIITLADVFANPTIASLAAKLMTRESSDSADIAIKINGGGADRPLFLTHCGNGELLYASALAPHIGRNTPLYGLPAISPDQAQPETIEEIATRMVRMIRSVQPAGPYRVAGWSLGGTVAYEIAAQLIGAHEQVEFIAMFDTYRPRSSTEARQARIDFNDSAFLLYLIESAGIEGDGRKAALDSIRARLHTMDFADVVQECDRLSIIPDTLRYLTIAQTRLKLARTHSLAVAAARYQPQPLHIPVHLFSALDAQHSGDSCRHRGWNDVVPNNLLCITPVPGSHHSMLRSPNVELLGRALTQAISQMT